MELSPTTAKSLAHACIKPYPICYTWSWTVGKYNLPSMKGKTKLRHWLPNKFFEIGQQIKGLFAGQNHEIETMNYLERCMRN